MYTFWLNIIINCGATALMVVGSILCVLAKINNSSGLQKAGSGMCAIGAFTIFYNIAMYSGSSNRSSPNTAQAFPQAYPPASPPQFQPPAPTNPSIGSNQSYPPQFPNQLNSQTQDARSPLGSQLPPGFAPVPDSTLPPDINSPEKFFDADELRKKGIPEELIREMLEKFKEEFPNAGRQENISNNRQPVDQPADRAIEKQETKSKKEVAKVELGVPSQSLPMFLYDKAKRTKSIGTSPERDIVQDPEMNSDRILVGLIVGTEQSNERVGIASVQAIYQTGREYVRGKRFGSKSAEEHLLIAPPGHVVVGLSGSTSLGIQGLHMLTSEINEYGSIQDSSPTPSVHMGKGSKFDMNITADGKLATGIYVGGQGEKLSAIGLCTATSLRIKRTWTSTKGKSIQAELLGMAEGSLKLKKEDGKEISVKLRDLSQEDQLFAKKFLATKQKVSN